MALVRVTGGLELSIPLPYTTNYHNDFVQYFAAPIATHDHSGGGAGTQLTTSAFADSSIDGDKIRLDNGQALRAVNGAGTGEKTLIYLDEFDEVSIGGGDVDIVLVRAGTTVTVFEDLRIRPTVAGALDLGSAGYPFNALHVNLFNVTTKTTVPAVDTGSPDWIAAFTAFNTLRGALVGLGLIQ